MKHYYSKILIFCLLSLIVGGIVSATTPAQRKSRHLLLKGMQANVEGKPDVGYELLSRAHKLDPANAEAAYNYALGKIALVDNPDSVDSEIGLVKRYVETYPADKEEVTMYAFLMQQMGDYDEALRVLERLSTYYPSNSELPVTMAGLATMKGDMAAARDYYSRYEKIEGASPEVSLRRMSLWLYEKDTIQALAEADRLIASNPGLPDFYVMKGNLYSYLEMPDSALAIYRRAEQIAPDNGGVRMAMANYYSEQADSLAYDGALYQALLCEDIDLDVKLEMLAEYAQPLFENKQSTTRADKLLATLREQYPHEAQIQDFSARYSAAKGEYQNAIDQIQVALDMDPTNDAYLTQKMSYLIYAKRLPDALALWQQSGDSITLTNIERAFYAVSAYTEQNMDDEALALGRKMLNGILPYVNPVDTLSLMDIQHLNDRGRRLTGSIYSLMGDIYYRRKAYADMALCYDNALTADDDNTMTKNNYAYYLCESDGDLDKALALSKQTIDEDPANVVYLDTYAWILFRKGDYKEALKYMESAMEQPDDEDKTYDYYDHYGDILFMNKRPAEALEQWQKALKMDPDNKLIQKKVKHKTYFYE